jgi:hypothetical protein
MWIVAREYSDIYESIYSSDNKINVKILSCGEQSVSWNDEENVSDSSSMQHGIWAKTASEQPCFPFTDKTDINIDLGDPSNPLEYFCTPEIMEVIARETNRYAQNFLGNT